MPDNKNTKSLNTRWYRDYYPELNFAQWLLFSNSNLVTKSNPSMRSEVHTKSSRECEEWFISHKTRNHFSGCQKGTILVNMVGTMILHHNQKLISSRRISSRITARWAKVRLREGKIHTTQRSVKGRPPNAASVSNWDTQKNSTSNCLQSKLLGRRKRRKRIWKLTHLDEEILHQLSKHLERQYI